MKTIKNSKNSSTKKSTTKNDEKSKKTTQNDETKKVENTTTTTLEVEAPDTSSNCYLYILGIMVLSSGTYYIYRNRELNN